MEKIQITSGGIFLTHTKGIRVMFNVVRDVIRWYIDGLFVWQPSAGL